MILSIHRTRVARGAGSLRTASRLTLTTVCLLALLTSCGGGGGSTGNGGGGGTSGPSVTGNGPAPNTGPGDTDAYFPLGADDHWYYAVTNTDPSAVAPLGDLAAHVNGTKTVAGIAGTVMTQTDSTSDGGPIDHYYASNAGGVTYLGSSDASDLLTPQLVPYVQLLFPVQSGQVSRVVGKGLPFGKDSAGNTISLDVTQTITNSAFEAVTVPAGSFPSALKQVTSISGTAKDGSQSIAVSGTDTSWLVSGVGVVKESIEAMAGTTPVTQTFDLRGYAVNGKKRGFGLPVALAPTDNQVYGAVGSIATDGTNYLVITQQFPPVVGSSQQDWIGTLVGPEGAIIGSFSINAPDTVSGFGTQALAVACYDGTNFLVAYTQDHAATVQPTTLDAVRVSPTGSVLGSPVSLMTLSNSSAGQYAALAFDGAQYLLVYVKPDTNDHRAIWGQFISPGSAQPAGAPFAIAPSASPLGHISLVYGGGAYLVAWDDMTPAGTISVLATRVSTGGVPLDATPLAIMSAPGMQANVQPTYPAVAYDGTNYLIAYRDIRAAQPGASTAATVSAARVSAAGALLDGSASTAGIVITSNDPDVHSPGRVAVAYLAGQYAVIWEYGQNGQLYGARVSTAGSVAKSATSGDLLVNRSYKVTASYDAAPKISANGQSGLLGWNFQESTNDVYVAPLYPLGP